MQWEHLSSDIPVGVAALAKKYPPPFFGALYFYSFTLVPAQEFDQFVAVDPDLMVTFFL